MTTFKDEVTTQPFWGNKKDLKGVRLLVPKILNRFETPKKSQSSREKHKHPRSAATGDLHFTASKRSFEGQKVKELHLALPISMRYYQPFHHTSQIWKIFHHQQAQETSSDKISAHQTVYNLKMLDNCSKCTFFLFLLSTNKNAHSRQPLGIHFSLKMWDILLFSVRRCAPDSETWSYYRLESLKLGCGWWIKFQGNAFFIHLAADDTFSTLYCLSVPKNMLWFKHSKYSHAGAGGGGGEWSARWKGLCGAGQKKQEVMAEVEGKTEGQEDGDEEKKMSVEVGF